MKFEESLEVIEIIASGFSKDSKEYEAIEQAAKALHYLFHADIEHRFTIFLKEFDSELTSEQKEPSPNGVRFGN